MTTNEYHNSDLEKTNLQVHVDLSRQRFMILAEKVEKVELRIDDFSKDLMDFRLEHARNISDLKESQVEALKVLRKENNASSQNTNQITIRAAGAVIAGLLSTIVVVLITFL